MAEINVSINDAAVLAGIARLKDALNDLTPLFQAIGDKLVQNTEIRFDTKRDPGGRAWQKWADSTREARRKEGRGTLLEYSGRMRASLDQDPHSDYVEVGFGVPYAKYHEQGKGVPRRQMLLDGNQLGKQDADDIFQVVHKFLQKTMP